MPEGWVLVEEPGVGEGGDRLAAPLLLGRIRYPLRCSYMRPDVVVSYRAYSFKKARKRTGPTVTEMSWHQVVRSAHTTHPIGDSRL
jgi:hypothetical protein